VQGEIIISKFKISTTTYFLVHSKSSTNTFQDRHEIIFQYTAMADVSPASIVDRV
jgi:hypothetical protein